MSLAVQATADAKYQAASQPTLYFIGVTTGKSSIMRVFPRWADELGLSDAVIRGVDCRQHDDRDVYRRIVEHIRDDSLSRGALVTTHKLDLLEACRDLFDELDEDATLMGEVSCISKRQGRLAGRAVDTMTSGLALEAFLPAEHWARTEAAVVVLGAGGSSLALTSHLLRSGGPSRIVVSNRSPRRLEQMQQIHQQLGGSIPCEYHHAPEPEFNDRLLEELPAGSLVVNATGLGKDAPGSPLTSAATFPQAGFVWEFNYRGDLEFLTQARAQAEARQLTVEDGWIYFLHGWTRVIAEVFDIEIPTAGDQFERLSEIAADTRK